MAEQATGLTADQVPGGALLFEQLEIDAPAGRRGSSAPRPGRVSDMYRSLVCSTR